MENILINRYSYILFICNELPETVTSQPLLDFYNTGCESAFSIWFKQENENGGIKAIEANKAKSKLVFITTNIIHVFGNLKGLV